MFILDALPFSNEMEAAVIIIGGLLVAIICSLMLGRLVFGQLREVLG
jgi:hypothetical protein